MKFENTSVMNFEGAFRGLRNPLESWAKSDSFFGIINLEYDYNDVFDDIISKWIHKENPDVEYGSSEWYNLDDKYFYWFDKNMILENGVYKVGEANIAALGPNDLDLAQRMIKAGTSDRKFLRQIFVSVDITAPLYWWKEMDTYKVGTTANSTSTMHKLASTPITIDCFETDDIQDVIIEDSNEPTFIVTSNYAAHTFIDWLEKLRQKYNETKDKKYWKELIRWLPESWLQTRTWTANYEILRNIYSQRKLHRLTEWHSFCDWVKTLPYAEELILYNLDK